MAKEFGPRDYNNQNGYSNDIKEVENPAVKPNAGAGILGLIIGLGAESLIADIIAGIFMVFEGEYQVGDIIVVDGWRGTVEEIGIRTTRIVDTGGKIYGNKTGVDFPGAGVILGGNPVIKDNRDDSGEDINLKINATIGLLEDFAGDVGVYADTTSGMLYGSPLTDGYKEGMEQCLSLDNPQAGRLKVVKADSYDLQQNPIRVTELAVTNHVDFMLDGSAVEGISSDYIYGMEIWRIIYSLNDNSEKVMREEFTAALKKPSDADYHYTFLQFLKESGEAYDFEEGYDSLTADIEIELDFEAEAHTFPQNWQNFDELSHKKTCPSCGYEAVEVHDWGQNRKTEEGAVLHECAACGASEIFEGNSQAFDEFFNSFGDITGSDGLSDGAKNYYDGATDDEKRYLDEAAKSEGYSGFSSLVEDMEAKSDFESDKVDALENLGTILRGCDGKKVRDELSLAIEKVEGAVYERCTDDDYRLDYLMGQKDSLQKAVDVLQNMRAQERSKSALEEYLNEKTKSGCYSKEALDTISARIQEIEEGLAEIDTQNGDVSAYIEQFLNSGMDGLDAVRAEAVVAGGKSLEEAVSGEYQPQSAEIYGYLSRTSGFNGNSKLSLTALPQTDGGLFGGRIRLTGDNLTGANVYILLPENARGYGGYYITVKSGANSQTVFAEEKEGVISFEVYGGASVVKTALAQSGELGEAEFTVSPVQNPDYTWLYVLISCLSVLAAAALCYVAIYFIKSKSPTA